MPRKLLLPFFACLAAAAVAQRPETFEDRLFVREVELVFEVPEPTLLHPNPPRENDLLVIEDGLVRPVIKAGSVDDAASRTALRKEGFEVAPWNAVVWIDEALSEPETVFTATLALARQASRLARLGSVEVVVADPEPEIQATATREARRLEQGLADLAGKARVERDRAAARPWEHSGVSSRPDSATLRRQLDRLLVHLAGRRDPGPRLLFLVADGFAVTPRESRAFETGAADPAAGERAAVIQDAARLLAAYGWTTVTLPLRKEGPGEEHRGSSDVDRFRANTGPSSHSSSVPPVMAPRRPKDSNLNWEGALRALIQPDLSPLRALSDTTAGTLVAQDALLPSALDRLGERWHLYYQTQMPMDGQVRPVEVRLRNGSTLRSRRWVRSSTPEGLAEARLRLLLMGERLPETLPLTVEPTAAGGLKLTIAPFSSPDPVTPGPVRISLACAGSGIRHETAPGIEAPDKGWSHTLAPPCHPAAVLVEDLARERWRAVRID
ncbi:MAG: hypothetical protein ACJ76J_23885 [Thermoanaerobaculia bacterium]